MTATIHLSTLNERTSMTFTYKNDTSGQKVFEDKHIFMGEQSSITVSDIDGNLNLNPYSHINNIQAGKYFNIGLFAYIANAVVGRYCTFGNRLSIGAFSHPTDWLSIHEFQYRDTTRIYGESLLSDGQNLLKSMDRTTQIGNDVWIADNAVVLRGISIGTGAIVGAASVVTKDVPPYAIVAGNPAKFVRFRFEQEVIERLQKIKWWELPMTELKGIQFSDIHQALSDLESKFPERFL